MVRSIIFSAPSGSGKTTIVKHILQTFPNIKFFYQQQHVQ